MNFIDDTVVFGDLHLGRKHNVTYGDASIWDNKSLETVKRLLSVLQPKNLILAGDVFDNSKPSSLAYSQLLAVISHVDNVYIIAGNHDISKITEVIAFDNLKDIGSNIHVIEHDTVETIDNVIFIGWHVTQTDYALALTNSIINASEGATIITHCSRLDFGNEMDNICTDKHIDLAKEKGVKIISGHEHKASIGDTFNHLGSVVPHTIAEVGPRYYYYGGKFEEIYNDGSVVLTREEPLSIDPDKVYYVKTSKEVTVEDLKLEEKDLSINIIDDFWQEAKKAGFSKGVLDD